MTAAWLDSFRYPVSATCRGLLWCIGLATLIGACPANAQSYHPRMLPLLPESYGARQGFGQRVTIAVMDPDGNRIPHIDLLCLSATRRMPIRTDLSGICQVLLPQGVWHIRSADPDLLNSTTSIGFDVPVPGDTLIHYIRKPDTFISGRVQGEWEQVEIPPRIEARGYLTRTGIALCADAAISSDGSYRIAVDSRSGPYIVTLEGWHLPADWVVLPAFCDADYRYRAIDAGRQDVHFTIIQPHGAIGGLCAGLAQEAFMVMATDMSRDFTVPGGVNDDRSFLLTVPIGMYALTAIDRSGAILAATTVIVRKDTTRVLLYDHDQNRIVSNTDRTPDTRFDTAPPDSRPQGLAASALPPRQRFSFDLRGRLVACTFAPEPRNLHGRPAVHGTASGTYFDAWSADGTGRVLHAPTIRRRIH